MHFIELVPSVFYTDLSDGLNLFVDCLQFTIEHKDLNASQPYCVLKKDGICIMIFQDEQLAKQHNPELRLVTDNIEEVYVKCLHHILIYYTQILTKLQSDLGGQKNLRLRTINSALDFNNGDN